MIKKFTTWARSLWIGKVTDQFLCDTCQYDYGSACTRPERPNARKCPDYSRRG